MPRLQFFHGSWNYFAVIAGEIRGIIEVLQHFREDNLDCSSIDGYIISKTSSRGPKHGPTERQQMFLKAKDMLQKAKKKKSDNTRQVAATTRKPPEFIEGLRRW